MFESGFEWSLFSKKQLESVALANARANHWHGAVRSGKTIGSIIRWLKHIHEMRAAKGHFLMTGVTHKTLKENILDVIEEMVGPENYHYKTGKGEVWICGTKCIIRGASDEASEKKIRGLTLKGHYGDEVTLWPKNYYRRGQDRLSVKGAKGFYTTNPDSPFHWLKHEYIDRGINGSGEINLLDFHFELHDNLSLDPDYVADLKREFTGLWYKRYILGLWVVADGAIYDMFDEKEHVVTTWESVWGRPERPPFEEVVAGIDYGSTNPTVMILLGLYKGTWYAFAEHRWEGQSGGLISRTPQEHRNAQEAFLQHGGFLPGRETEPHDPILPRYIVLDPSAADYRTELKKNGWSGTKEVANADNDVLQGIMRTSSALSSHKLKIHISCEMAIKEFMTYVWDPKAAEEHGRDKPIKQHDHSLDAIRYAMMKAIKPGTTGKRQRAVPKPKGA